MSNSSVPTRRRRPLRRALVAATLLLIGAAFSIAFAWSCVAWGELRLLVGQTVRPANVVPGGTGWLAPEHLDWPADVPTNWGPAQCIARSESFGLVWRGG